MAVPIFVKAVKVKEQLNSNTGSIEMLNPYKKGTPALTRKSPFWYRYIQDSELNIRNKRWHMFLVLVHNNNVVYIDR
jgi:hypothetical protein